MYSRPAGTNRRGEDSPLNAKLKSLYEKTFGVPPEQITPIRAEGSDRLVFRLGDGKRTVIGIAHDDQRENAAFIGFSRHFHSIGLPVPEILATDESEGVYLETDLGDVSLASLIAKNNQDNTDRRSGATESPNSSPGDAALSVYRKAVSWLPRIQIEGHKGIDYSLCYQDDRFGPKTMEHDLRYFETHFLGLLYREKLDRDLLAADFQSLVKFLMEEPDDFLLYRDFQTRNIMVVKGEPWFIDYQSGRRGPLAYDLAALLYAGKSGLNDDQREDLIATYLDQAESIQAIDRDQFLAHFPGFALIRILQALGAYANLGVNKGKEQFLERVPFGIQNLGALMERYPLSARFSYLGSLLSRIVDSPDRYVEVPTNE